MTNFERLMQCKTADEVAKMLISVEGDACIDTYCAGRGCSDVWDCRRRFKEWLLSEFSGQKSDEYKPRHMRVDA